MDRRTVAKVVLVITVVVLVSGSAVFQRPQHAETGPYADGVAVDGEGRLTLLPAGSQTELLPGSRVIAPDADADAETVAAAERLAQQQRDWLASGWRAAGPEYQDMVDLALLDMHVLSSGGGTLAAMNPNWRYVWPRDSSFAAAAFAVSGHHDDAVAALDFLQDVQGEDGSFEARYLPDGSGTPDDRLPQTDGTGWALWALDVLVSHTPRADRADLLIRFAPLLQRSTEFLLDQVDNRQSLPAPSPDYWEHRERVITLGTAAPVLAGLEAAARLHTIAGVPDLAATATTAAADTRDAVVEFFGSRGYPRYPGPSHPDAASAFLLPPFQPTALPEAEAAWRSSVTSMLRPAGGIAPGGGWREVNLSWTPQTALYALAAASIGDEDQARIWLTWLDTHRSPVGALPEKVNREGAPAGPAPLAWTAALVVLTVHTLESRT